MFQIIDQNKKLLVWFQKMKTGRAEMGGEVIFPSVERRWEKATHVTG